MKIIRGYKYKLSLTKEQETLILNHFFTSNQAWNITKSIKDQEHLDNEKRISPEYIPAVELDNQIKNILTKRELSFNTKVIQQARTEYLTELKKFFKKLKNDNTDKISPPGFRAYHSTKTFSTTKEQYKIKRKNGKTYLRLFSQYFEINLSRKLPKNLSSVRIIKNSAGFFVIFTVKFDLAKVLKPKVIRAAGLDVNIDSLDLGNKDFYERLKNSSKKDNLIKINKKKIKKLKRKQSRRVLKAKKTKIKVSKNFQKTQYKINKIFLKNSAKKHFNIHKLVNDIIKIMKEKELNTLVVEDLDVKNMTSKKNIVKMLGKSKSKAMRSNILQISFGMIINILEYKCAENGIYLIKIDPKNTSKKCSGCGKLNYGLSLKDREYSCECGLLLPRDYNSCLNIVKKGVECAG